MESTVSNQIIEVLNMLCEKFGVAIDWSAQNVLPYAQELMNKVVKYELWTDILYLILCFAAVFIYFFFVKWYYKQTRNNDIDEGIDILCLVFTVVGSIALVICIFVIFACANDIIACLTFPEKIVFDIIQSMM